MGLKKIDKMAEEKGSFITTLWQFVKFIVVSLGAFVIQTFLPLLIKLLPPIKAILNEPYAFFVFESDGTENNGLGIFIAATISNIIAQIVAFFINKEKTFNSSANVAITLPIYIVFTIALICFSAWLTPTLQGFFVSKGMNVDLALSITSACCGAIQFFLYFPVDKILFRKKKEDKEDK
ncbi:MAG: hypothetical protein PUB20_08760 [Clostridia bacterium]|nr:hypothetical protein [Clostridia bacterium]